MSGGVADFDFELPSSLVAQDPPERRGDSRLLLVDPGRDDFPEIAFRELPDRLRTGDLLVVNRSRVLPARLLVRRVGSGGRVELLLVRPDTAAGTWLAMARPARRLRTGAELELARDDGRGKDVRLAIVDRRDDGHVLIRSDPDPARLAETWGHVPLPPYIRRRYDDPAESARHDRDRRRYQCVYAADETGGAGSVAAPTAGLHFSRRTLDLLAERDVTVAAVRLHVGPGTFRPPSSQQLRRGLLHEESFELPGEVWRAWHRTRADGGRVIAVGTTSLRVLETVARLELPVAGGPDRIVGGDGEHEFTGTARWRDGAWSVAGSTRLFLRPPRCVTCVDGLLTNFHLPGSSLLMLVACLLGDRWRAVYAHAVAAGLRFYSYGDCMLILPGVTATPPAHEERR